MAPFDWCRHGRKHTSFNAGLAAERLQRLDSVDLVSAPDESVDQPGPHQPASHCAVRPFDLVMF
jgi:hypothetical protein